MQSHQQAISHLRLLAADTLSEGGIAALLRELVSWMMGLKGVEE